MIPTDRLTMRSTIFDSRLYDRKAAAEMLSTPARTVASKMEESVALILNPGLSEKPRD
jgi:hypothetical protein